MKVLVTATRNKVYTSVELTPLLNIFVLKNISIIFDKKSHPNTSNDILNNELLGISLFKLNIMP